jgi:RecJ-like exonuclease
MLKLFIQCAQSIKIRVLFDALDECNDDELGKVYQLIETLCEAKVGVYVTTRPHIVDLVRQQKRFARATYMENITADGMDISNFLEQRIQEHREPIEADLMKGIVRTIGNAEGMYQTLSPDETLITV